MALAKGDPPLLDEEDRHRLLVDATADSPTRSLQTAAQEGRFEYEGWRVRKDGSRLWAYVTSTDRGSGGQLRR
jgi:hypothetical protein